MRFRTLTRTRSLAKPYSEREACLREIYSDNLNRLFKALEFCHDRGIALYRMSSALFPQNDDPAGEHALASLRDRMAGFGERARELGVRVVLHPDQFVVLNSLLPKVAEQSLNIMAKHAEIFDALGLPRSTWAAMTLHGGKGGRADALVEVIERLPASIRHRLVLENDERTYGAAAILDICRRAKVPMVFDAHHHVIHEKLDSFEHPSIRKMVRAARDTWPDPDWQIVHLSNGRQGWLDPRHSEMITTIPSAFREVPWIEVEAKAKELAIDQLRRTWLSHES